MAQFLDIFGFLAVLLRGATLAFQSLVIGGIVFSLCIAKASRKLLAWGSVALIVTQVFYLLADAAILHGTADVPWKEVPGATFFIAGAIAIVAACAVLLLLRKSGRLGFFALLPAGAILFSSILTSHAAARLDHPLALSLLTAIHQAATAVWVGGIPYLLIAFSASKDDVPALSRTLSRFSKLALISAGSLATAGFALSYFYVGSMSALYGTSYGIMVVAKILLFGVLVLLGGMNYFLGKRLDSGRGVPVFLRLRRFAEAEIGIGFTVILAAASLTSQPPAADLVQGRAAASEVLARLTPEWPRLTSPAPGELSTPLPSTAAPLASYVPGATESQRSMAGIAWSEYNHHWAGLCVLAMGLLAVAARWFGISWAKHWPLAFLGLALFLFIRADPENWPLGPNGFWESFKVAEVAQHRLYVVLITIFAAFEWGVQTGRVTAARAAMVFPMVCAAGGALLLTHSHSLSNVKEELLAEISHVPLALLGVTAGWARWLELRLAPGDRAIPSRVWPVCFVLVGAVLLLYRES